MIYSTQGQHANHYTTNAVPELRRRIIKIIHYLPNKRHGRYYRKIYAAGFLKMYAEIKQKIQIIKQYICTLLEKQMESEE